MSPASVPEVVVVVVSTRAAAGTRPDTVGPALVNELKAAGWDIGAGPVVVPDDEPRLVELLEQLSDDGHRLVVTTGGTGLTPTDRTPEATAWVADRLVPGLAELMRAEGVATTPLAALSRGVVGTRGATLIVNLPGSPSGARESLHAILPVLRHAVDQLSGGDDHG